MKYLCKTRIVVCLLLAALSAQLIACGEKAEESASVASSSAPAAQTTTLPPEPVKEEEEEEAEETPVAEEIPGVNAVDPSMSHITYTVSRETPDVLKPELFQLSGVLKTWVGGRLTEYIDSMRGLVQVSFDRIAFADDTQYPALAQSIYALQESVYEDVLSAGTRALGALRLSGGPTDSFFYRESHDVTVFRADSVLFCYAQDGQVHNLRTDIGRHLTLEDAVTDRDALFEKAVDVLIETSLLAAPKELQSDLQETYEALDRTQAAKAISAQEGLIWVPAYLGLRLIFDKAPVTGEEGLADITIPYASAPDLFDPAVTHLPEGYIARLSPYTAYEYARGERTDSITVSPEMRFVSYGDNGFVQLTGNITLSASEEGGDPLIYSVSNFNADSYTSCDQYLVSHEGKTFLYLDVLGRDGTDLLHVFALEDEGARFVGRSQEMIDTNAAPPLNPAHFTVEHYYRIFPDTISAAPGETTAGTRALNTAAAGEDGMPVTEFTDYAVTDVVTFHTRQELPLEVLAEEGSDQTVSEVFPPGTQLTLIRYRLNVSVDFLTPDGRCVRMFINGVDGIDNIGGIPIEEAIGYGAPPQEN